MNPRSRRSKRGESIRRFGICGLFPTKAWTHITRKVIMPRVSIQNAIDALNENCTLFEAELKQPRDPGNEGDHEV